MSKREARKTIKEERDLLLAEQGALIAKLNDATCQVQELSFELASQTEISRFLAEQLEAHMHAAQAEPVAEWPDNTMLEHLRENPDAWGVAE